MVQQVTNGIKVSVKTEFIGINYHNDRLHYAFSYQVTIENQSNDSVQLLKRHWNIFDSIGEFKEVNGVGVVGKQPILKPGEQHQYVSGCSLKSEVGRMSGDYLMQRMEDAAKSLMRAADTSAAVNHAEKIAANAMKLDGMFKMGSGGPKTRAKDAIWLKNDDFKSFIKDLQRTTKALVAAAKSGNQDAVNAAIRNVGKNCGGCHDSYRGPKI